MAFNLRITIMIEFINRLLYIFSDEYQRHREQEEMNRFLSEATDRFHLEKLEREWFKNHRR